MAALVAEWASADGVVATFSEIALDTDGSGDATVLLVARPEAKLWKDYLVTLLLAARERLGGAGTTHVTDLVSGRPWAGGSTQL